MNVFPTEEKLRSGSVSGSGLDRVRVDQIRLNLNVSSAFESRKSRPQIEVKIVLTFKHSFE
jgi:hypothetical protein